MYQAPMSLKEIIVNRLRNYFFLNIMQHLIQRFLCSYFGQKMRHTKFGQTPLQSATGWLQLA